MDARPTLRQRVVGTPVHDLLGLWMIVWAYAPMVAALWTFHRWPNVATFLLALVVITARMNALFVVAHESWHYNVFRSRRLNEIIGAIFAAWPILLPYAHSRTSHWNHHRYVGTERDPDAYAWRWSDGERGALAKEVFLAGSGLAYVLRVGRLLLGAPPAAPAEGRPPRPALPRDQARREIPRLALVHLAMVAIFWKTVGPLWYFPLWLFPALGPFPVVAGLREFLEHRRGALIVYKAGPIERFVFGCFNFHLHAYHHAYAAAPWFTLPDAKARALKKMPDVVFLNSYFAELFAYFAGRSRAPTVIPAAGGGALPAGDVPLRERAAEEM